MANISTCASALQACPGTSDCTVGMEINATISSVMRAQTMKESIMQLVVSLVQLIKCSSKSSCVAFTLGLPRCLVLPLLSCPGYVVNATDTPSVSQSNQCHYMLKLTLLKTRKKTLSAHCGLIACTCMGFPTSSPL